ncbi:hypothetical protein ACVIW2_003192 [Bradyrhizobium huanghuaihaiense]
MKNLGGTEVISRALEVLFVAGLAPARPAALQLAFLPARGTPHQRPLTPWDTGRRADLCAARSDPRVFHG